MSEKDQGAEQPEAFDLTALEIDQILGLFIGILSAKAWQYMGLQVAPGRKAAEKDMARAAVAIDCISYMADKLVPLIPESEAGRLRAMITDLKINYARNA